MNTEKVCDFDVNGDGVITEADCVYNLPDGKFYISSRSSVYDDNANLHNFTGMKFAESLNAIAESRLAEHRFGVSALAREMEMSRSGLHRKVKATFHESASQFISHKRLEKARQLLLDKKISVTKTASLCGFHSVT